MTARFAAVLIFLCSCHQTSSTLEEVTIFAASSVGPALQNAAAYLKKHHQIRLRIHTAASSVLGQQIRYGASCDLVLLADDFWMQELVIRGKIEHGTKTDLLSNRLAIISQTHPTFQLQPPAASDWLSQKLQGRFVVGDPAHVPLGKYTKVALQNMRVWSSLGSHLLYASDARAALFLVEQGEAQAGVVYLSDARTSKKINIITVIPETLHAPIRYPLAICKNKEKIAAAAVQKFLMGTQAKAIFKQYGFETL